LKRNPDRHAPADHREALCAYPAEAAVQPDCLCLGDACQVMRGIPDNAIHLIVTSPPYWNMVDYGFKGQIGQESYATYLARLLDVWKEAERVLVPNGKLCINTPIMPVPKKMDDSQHTRTLKNINNDIEAGILAETDLARYSLFIWQKQTTEKMFGSYPYPPNLYEQNTVEFINVFVKPGKPRKLPKPVKDASLLTEAEWMDLTKQVWFMMPADIRRAGAHPAPFPEALPARLIKLYTFQSVPDLGFCGDLVLDMFNGSGTTTYAAKRLKRRFIGIEASAKYHAFAEARMRGAPPPFAPEELRTEKMDKKLLNPLADAEAEMAAAEAAIEKLDEAVARAKEEARDEDLAAAQEEADLDAEVAEARWRASRGEETIP
jgi:DNA modification methylase